MTLDQLRAEFERSTNRSMSMPLAGLLVWLLVGAAALLLPFRQALLLLIVATGLIFPLALGIARWRGEQLVSSTNPLARLMGQCIVMVNLLWAVHVPLLLQAPAFVPLSLGIALGLHWVVYSWIIQHPLGLVHAVLRTLLVAAAWWLVPDHRITAVAAAVVLAYGLSLVQMQTRPLPAA